MIPLPLPWKIASGAVLLALLLVGAVGLYLKGRSDGEAAIKVQIAAAVAERSARTTRNRLGRSASATRRSPSCRPEIDRHEGDRQCARHEWLRSSCWCSLDWLQRRQRANARHPDRSPLTECSPADQVPPPRTDKVIAGVIVDLQSKLEDCATRHKALADFEKADSK